MHKIFISTSFSEADKQLLVKLETHLIPLNREGLISFWHRDKIRPGEDRGVQVSKHMNDADVILLLISPDFLASKDCMEDEVEHAMRRYPTVWVVPVLLRTTAWQQTKFGRLMPLPKDYTFITGQPGDDIDRTFNEIAMQLREIVAEMGKGQMQPHAATNYRIISCRPPAVDSNMIQQRKSVVKAIYELLSGPETSAVVITGMAGLGKTTTASLVRTYLEQQRKAEKSYFSAETVWLEVDPMTEMHDLVGNLFECIGKAVPDMSNRSLKNQAMYLCDTLNASEQRRLIVLDQFEHLLDDDTGYAHTDQHGINELLDALNSQKCLSRILLTSRTRIQLMSTSGYVHMQPYPLPKLTTNEGTGLLRTYLPEERDEMLRQAVERYEGNAAALTLLANFLKEHQRNLATLLKDQMTLRNVTGNIADKVVGPSFQQLDPVQRRLLCAFAIYREPVPYPAVERIIGTTPGAWDMALKALLRQHLLIASGGCYQLPAVVAEYAYAYMLPQNTTAGQNETFVLREVHAIAADYYIQDGEKSQLAQRRRRDRRYLLMEAAWHWCQAQQWRKAYSLLQQERLFTHLKQLRAYATLLELCHALLAVEKWQAKAWEEAYLQKLVGQVYDDLWQKDRAQEYYMRALRLSRVELKNYEQAAEILNYLALIYNTQGKKEDAVRCLEQALKYNEDKKDLREEAATLSNLGRVYDDRGDKQEALHHYEQALDIFKKGGDYKGTGVTCKLLADICNRLGMDDEATSYYEEAQRNFSLAGDPKGEAEAQNGLARVLNGKGKSELALANCQNALRLFKQIQDRDGEGYTLSNMGDIYRTSGRYKEAEDAYMRSKVIFRYLGDYDGEGKTLNKLGSFYDDRAAKEKALKFYGEACVAFKKVGNRGGEGWVLHNMGMLYSAAEDQLQALKFYTQALVCHQEVHNIKEEGSTCHSIGVVYMKWNQLKEALKYFKQALYLSRSTQDHAGEAQVLCNLGILYYQKPPRYDVALAALLLALALTDRVQTVKRDEVQAHIDAIAAMIGPSSFDKLRAQVEPQAQQILDDALARVK